MVLIAREPLRSCGMSLVERVIGRAHAPLKVTRCVEDGVSFGADDELAAIEGPVQWLLSLERTWLNFLQRLCGIATHVHSLTSKNPTISLLDTRKTTPGWRMLEKYAVSCGGGTNHRLCLGDMVLIKNNHLDAVGVDSVEKARDFFARIRAKKPWHTPIECEVRSLAELRLVLAGEPEFVMLDNMSNAEIAECVLEVNKCAKAPTLEVSGDVTAARLSELALIGVRFASMGALTTNVRAVDISARMRPSAS